MATAEPFEVVFDVLPSLRNGTSFSLAPEPSAYRYSIDRGASAFQTRRIAHQVLFSTLQLRRREFLKPVANAHGELVAGAKVHTRKDVSGCLSDAEVEGKFRRLR